MVVESEVDVARSRQRLVCYRLDLKKEGQAEVAREVLESQVDVTRSRQGLLLS